MYNVYIMKMSHCNKRHPFCFCPKVNYEDKQYGKARIKGIWTNAYGVQNTHIYFDNYSYILMIILYQINRNSQRSRLSTEHAFSYFLFTVKPYTGKKKETLCSFIGNAYFILC